MQAILDFAGQQTHVLRGRLPPALFFQENATTDFGHADQANFSTIFCFVYRTITKMIRGRIFRGNFG